MHPKTKEIRTDQSIKTPIMMYATRMPIASVLAAVSELSKPRTLVEEHSLIYLLVLYVSKSSIQDHFVFVHRTIVSK